MVDLIDLIDFGGGEGGVWPYIYAKMRRPVLKRIVDATNSTTAKFGIYAKATAFGL